MKKELRLASEVIGAWGRILRGYSPILSIEITRECPLTCPGCYAYNPEHLGGSVTLRQIHDKKGTDLVEGILQLIKKYKPLHVSLVGGEPLVRARELDQLLPLLSNSGIHTQLVTSGVRALPVAWSSIRNLTICVSIDGLQPEHDARRKPATYERILKNIEGHQITVHCTVTRQQLQREDYLEEFVQFWSNRDEVAKIWMSLYTPQKNEVSEERLRPEDRLRAVSELFRLRSLFKKLDLPKELIRVYEKPPAKPQDCVFANASTCISADLQKKITPCQFGGDPDCENCGCMASAGLAAIGRHPLKFGIEAGDLFTYSQKIGSVVSSIRKRLHPGFQNGQTEEP
jgi:MoaA/NifB/PqqE/SkfB family radical SAM enzyme